MSRLRCLPILAAAAGLVALTLATPGAASQGDTIRVRPGARLQAAIDAAPPGTVLLLGAGTHRGPATVRRSITLGGAEGARILGPGEGTVLILDAPDVRVRDLEIAGSGRNLSRDDAGVLVLGDRADVRGLRLRGNLHGIYVRGAREVRLTNNDVAGPAESSRGEEAEARAAEPGHEGVHDPRAGGQALLGNGIHLWNADGARVEDNRIRDVRDGIYVAHSNDAVFARNRVSRSRYGIHYMYSSDNRLVDNELYRNIAGAALMFSRRLVVERNLLREHSGLRAYGLLLQDLEESRFADNEIRGNRIGVRLQSSTTNELRGNRISANLTGIVLGSASSDNRFTQNVVGPNVRNIELTGRPPPTEWSLEGVGNWWAGAMPLDLTGDGISEWPHHEVDVLAGRRKGFPVIELLLGSPGVRALEWALSRAPVPGSRFVTDPHPLAGSRSRD